MPRPFSARRGSPDNATVAMRRRAAEVRAASARKAAREGPTDGDSDSDDDYYDLFASRERIKNGRLTLDGGAADTADAKERRRRAFNPPVGTPAQKHTNSPISATIRDVFAEYSGGKARIATASAKSPGQLSSRPKPLEQSYGEALRDIYSLTPGGKRSEDDGSPEYSARRAVRSRSYAAERAAEEKADDFRRRREHERSMRERSLGPAEFLALGKEGSHGSPILHSNATPGSHVQGTLREMMGEYTTSSGERNSRSPTQRVLPSHPSHPPSSVSFSLPSEAGHGGYVEADRGDRDVSAGSQGSAVLYTTLNGDARRVSRSLEELKQANLSLTSGLRDLQRELEQERQMFEAKFRAT